MSCWEAFPVSLSESSRAILPIETVASSIKKHLRSVRSDSGLHEAGAVGLARSNVDQAGTGTGNLTSAVVAGASQGGGDERQNNGGLHCELRVIRDWSEEIDF